MMAAPSRMNVSDITRAMGTTCGFLKTRCVNGAATTTTTHTAVPSKHSETKPALMSSSVNSGFWTKAEPHAHPEQSTVRIAG